MVKKTSPARAAEPWAAALRLLTRRDYSCAELRDRLAGKEFAPEAISEVLQRCQALGYLDDSRYAELRAKSLLRQGRAAGYRLINDLKQRGISEAIARRALAQAEAETSEQSVLAQLAERRFPNFVYASAPAKERRRVIQFLQRRGFALDGIMTYFTEKGSQ